VNLEDQDESVSGTYRHVNTLKSWLI